MHARSLSCTILVINFVRASLNMYSAIGVAQRPFVGSMLSIQSYNTVLSLRRQDYASGIFGLTFMWCMLVHVMLWLSIRFCHVDFANHSFIHMLVHLNLYARQYFLCWHVLHKYCRLMSWYAERNIERLDTHLVNLCYMLYLLFDFKTM